MTQRERKPWNAAKDRRELIEAGFSRRDLFKMGLLTGAGDLVAKGCLSVRADEQTQLRGGQSMIFMVPKFTGAAYFAATEKGAKEAVAELKGRGVAIDFLYTGPSVANTDEEIRMIDDLVAQKPDAIIIAANHADAMVPVVKKAKTSGIKVITYDADVADPTARQWFVNQGTFTLVGGSARRRGGRTGRGERALRRREYRSGCVQPELLDRRHEGADAGEVPEDAAGRHPLWAGQTRGVVQHGPGPD
jgi:hypothetical protein